MLSIAPFSSLEVIGEIGFAVSLLDAVHAAEVPELGDGVGDPVVQRDLGIGHAERGKWIVHGGCGVVI